MLGLKPDADDIEGSDCMRMLDLSYSRNGNSWLPTQKRCQDAAQRC
jgi:hypothetical protein